MKSTCNWFWGFPWWPSRSTFLRNQRDGLVAWEDAFTAEACKTEAYSLCLWPLNITTGCLLHRALNLAVCSKGTSHVVAYYGKEDLLRRGPTCLKTQISTGLDMKKWLIKCCCTSHPTCSIYTKTTQWAPLPLSREGSLSCYACSDTGPRFLRSQPKDSLVRGTEDLY